jgi:hypothetical protein
MIEIVSRGIEVDVWRGRKTVLKSGRFRAAFFFVARHYYLTGRPNRLFFGQGGRGGRGGPRGAPGAPGGPPGGSRGGSRGVQNRKYKNL